MNDNFLFKNTHVIQWYENVCVVSGNGAAVAVIQRCDAPRGETAGNERRGQEERTEADFATGTSTGEHTNTLS